MNILAIAALWMMMQGGTLNNCSVSITGEACAAQQGKDWRQYDWSATQQWRNPYPDWRLQGFAADPDWYGEDNAKRFLNAAITETIPAGGYPYPDVPAKRVTDYSFYLGQTNEWWKCPGAVISNEEETHFTCYVGKWECQGGVKSSDYAILESVDHSKAVCHRITP